MKYVPLFITLLLLLQISCTHKLLKPQPDSKIFIDTLIKSTLDKPFSFPHDWLGYWSGKLNIYNSAGLSDQITMALDISKTDSIGLYNWTIIYGTDSTAQRREYQLKEIDSQIGHYLIDEKNGILIDAFLIQNELNSIFEVMGNTLIISYALKNSELQFTVKVFPSKEKRISGDIEYETQEIPTVKSFELKSVQTAKLYKKCLVE